MLGDLMPCGWCAWARLGRNTGRYHFNCARCCARLLRSARPMKPAQETMLAVIAMRPGRPDKSEILASLKVLDAEADQRKAAALARLVDRPAAP